MPSYSKCYMVIVYTLVVVVRMVSVGFRVRGVLVPFGLIDPETKMPHEVVGHAPELSPNIRHEPSIYNPTIVSGQADPSWYQIYAKR